MKAKSLQKLLMIKEICSWLSPGLDGRKVCSPEHISLITNSFLAALCFTDDLTPIVRLSTSFW